MGCCVMSSLCPFLFLGRVLSVLPLGVLDVKAHPAMALGAAVWLRLIALQSEDPSAHRHAASTEEKE